MIGRRVVSLGDIERAGDYCGPVKIQGDDTGESCFFLAPNSPTRHGLCRVAFPPHTYRECGDGSLEIRASILVYPTENAPGWHGFLDEGHVWREC